MNNNWIIAKKVGNTFLYWNEEALKWVVWKHFASLHNDQDVNRILNRLSYSNDNLVAIYR